MKATNELIGLAEIMKDEAKKYGPSRAGRLMYGCGETIRKETNILAEQLGAQIRVSERLEAELREIKGSKLYRFLKKLHIFK
jgi:hypothetical protein